jgi:hypothetical protein
LIVIPEVFHAEPACYDDIGGKFIIRGYVNAKLSYEEMMDLKSVHERSLLINKEEELFCHISKLLNQKYPDLIEELKF